MQFATPVTATVKKKLAGGGNGRARKIVLELSDYTKRIIGVIKDHGLEEHVAVNIHINKFKSQTISPCPQHPGTELDYTAAVTSVIVQLKITHITCLEQALPLDADASHTQVAQLVKAMPLAVRG